MDSSNLSSILECPVCLDICRPPIYQCTNGHIICPKCIPHVRNACPTCRTSLTDKIRSRVAESLYFSAHLEDSSTESYCTSVASFNKAPCSFPTYNSKSCLLFIYENENMHEILRLSVERLF